MEQIMIITNEWLKHCWAYHKLLIFNPNSAIDWIAKNDS